MATDERTDERAKKKTTVDARSNLRRRRTTRDSKQTKQTTPPRNQIVCEIRRPLPSATRAPETRRRPRLAPNTQTRRICPSVAGVSKPNVNLLRVPPSTNAMSLLPCTSPISISSSQPPSHQPINHILHSHSPSHSPRPIHPKKQANKQHAATGTLARPDDIQSRHDASTQFL